ncbi:MAG TPA: hypothetical protein VFJ14_17870 [Nocardioidaceae bacterium]|nr:hypothetical protein [Nocardioidaceae bacterium]
MRYKMQPRTGITIPAGTPGLVGPQEIAELLGVQTATVHRWMARDLLPDPTQRISGVPIWHWPLIESWARDTGRLP